MKQFLTSLLLSAAALCAAASVTLQDNTFRVDTLEHYKAGPGVTYTRLHLGGPVAIDVHALTMSTDPANKTSLKVILGHDSAATTETVSSMARRHTLPDSRQVIAGTNADFFITSAFAATLPWGNAVLGYPNMSCVIDGKIAAPDIIDKVSRENALVTDSEGGLWIDATDMTYKLLSNDGEVNLSMAAANFPRGDNEIVFYNSLAGKYTKTQPGGREIAVRLADGASWRMNKSVKMTVVGEWSTSGNMRIPEDGGVISVGRGYSNAWLDALTEGDIVKVKFNLKLPSFESLAPDVKNVVGGDVRLLREGVTVMEANRWINARDARNPRTMVGYSKDRSTVVLCAVDGRGASAGCTYPEGADIMRFLGCYDALDFDGGGSTAMYLSHAGIVNRPSDGSERAVGNGLFIQLDAPFSDVITEIRFHDWAKTLPRYGIYRPVIYGYNSHGMLIDTDVQGCTLSCDPALGEILDGGTSLFASGSGNHPLIASLGDLTASIDIAVSTMHNAEPRYNSVVIDNRRDYKIELQALVDNKYLAVDPMAFTWESDNANVVTVTPQGVLHAEKNGVATVTGTGENHSVAITVSVENPAAQTMPALSGEFDPAAWSVARTSVSEATVAASGDKGLRIDLATGSSVRGAKISAVGDVRLWGQPDALEMTVNPGNLEVTASSVKILPTNSTMEVTVTTDSSIAKDCDTQVRFDLSSQLNLSDTGIYPLHLTAIAFNLSPSTKSKYVINIPSIDAVYSGAIPDGVDDIAMPSASKHLTLTVTPQGNIVLPTIASQIQIIDTTARTVARATSTETIVAPSTPGVYIIHATIAGIPHTAKLLIR